MKYFSTYYNELQDNNFTPLKFKYSENFDELNTSIEQITDYCMNLEIGKYIFENQKIIIPKDDFKKAQNFPKFNFGNIHIFLKSPYGIIYVPEDLLNSFIKEFEKKMMAKSKQFYEHFGFNHLLSYNSLEIETEAFVLLKAESKDIKGSHGIRTIIKEKKNTFNSLISYDRSTWVISNIENFIEFIVTSKTDNLLQYVMIIYDPEHIINLKNGDLLTTNFDIKQFKLCTNIIGLTYYGTEEYLRNTLKDNNIINSKFMDLTSWYESHYRPYFCVKRKTSFEVIRLLGNFKLYEPILMSDVKILDVDIIYQIEWNQIKLENMNNCFHCKTPLFGEIYAIFDNINTIVGKAYCPICIHTPNVIKNNNTDNYITKDKVIGRLTHPKKIEDIITNANIDDILREFIIQGFGNHLIDTYQDNKVIYFNFFEREKNRAKNLICFTGDIEEFINYGLFNRHQKILEYMNINTIRDYIQNNYVIPIQLVDY